MFDAKSILDALVRGGTQQQQGQDDLGGLSDLLKQLAGADKDPQVSAPRGPSRPGGARDDDPTPEPPPRGQTRAPSPDEDEDAPGRQAPGGGLEDILREVLGGGRGGGGGLGDILGKLGKEGGGGGLGDILGQILGQGGAGRASRFLR